MLREKKRRKEWRKYISKRTAPASSAAENAFRPADDLCVAIFRVSLQRSDFALVTFDVHFRRKAKERSRVPILNVRDVHSNRVERQRERETLVTCDIRCARWLIAAVYIHYTNRVCRSRLKTGNPGQNFKLFQGLNRTATRRSSHFSKRYISGRDVFTIFFFDFRFLSATRFHDTAREDAKARLKKGRSSRYACGLFAANKHTFERSLSMREDFR